MEATELLMSEHRIIEGFLASLENAVQKIDQKQTVRPGFFTDAADFSKGFTDGCHHRKEEGYLFPALVRQGMSNTEGPVAVLLDEHEQGRRMIKAMRLASQQWQEGDPKAMPVVLEHARNYVSLLKKHIQKEDGVLFPLTDRTLSMEAQETLANNFEHVEEEEVGAGVHEKYLGMAETLRKEVS